MQLNRNGNIVTTYNLSDWLTNRGREMYELNISAFYIVKEFSVLCNNSYCMQTILSYY